MNVRAFKLGDVTAHHYGGGQIVLWQPKNGDRFDCQCVRVSAKKLRRKLKKFLRGK